MPTDLPKERTIFRRSLGPPPWRPEKHVELLPTVIPPTSILIRVHAVSLNFRDANILNGTNPWPVIEGGAVGSDAAGEVIAVGSHVKRFVIGDRVAPILDHASITGEEQGRIWPSADVDGVLASHLVMDEQVCVKLPNNLTWAELSCLPCAGVTAWSSLVTDGKKLVAGQTVLLQGTGGVSLMALKLGLAAGCKIIITSSSDGKLARIVETYGKRSIHTINYRTTADWDKEVLRLNNGVGADIVLENGGSSSTIRSLRAVKKGGYISQVGYLGKQNSSDLEGLIPLLIDRAVNFRGINVGSRNDFEQMNKVIDAAQIRFEDVVDCVFPFERSVEAIGHLWSGSFVGKIVIDVSGWSSPGYVALSI